MFKLGFFPSFFSILVSAMYIFYQVQSFRDSVIFDGEREHRMLETVLTLWGVMSAGVGSFIGIVVLVVFVLLMWFFAPMLCSAAVAFYVGQVQRGKKLEGGVMQGIFHFFPLFEMQLMKRGLAPLAFFSSFSFIARNVSLDAGMVIAPVLTFFAALGVFVLFLLAFATPAIMLLNKNFAGAIGTSGKITMSNFGVAIKIALVILLIEMRVLLNVVIVFAVPVLLTALAGFAATYIGPVAIIWLIAVVGLLTLIVASYLTGILFVFSEVIWTLAFLRLAAEMEDDFDVSEYIDSKEAVAQ